MPLTKYQLRISRLLAKNRSADSFLAGGVALHFHPNGKRYSNDLDYFHDSIERVAAAFANDSKTLEQNGFCVNTQISQPGFIRAIVSLKKDETKIEWSHDSAWRFMPTVYQDDLGATLHPVDIAVNKVLALAGRNEARDFIDTLFIHNEILPLGALCWAAVEKDPGFTPHSLLSLIRRRGRFQPSDFAKLNLKDPVNIPDLKEKWLTALDEAESFFDIAGPETGCLFYDLEARKFLQPANPSSPSIKRHFGSAGGVIPTFYTLDPLIIGIKGRFDPISSS